MTSNTDLYQTFHLEEESLREVQKLQIWMKKSETGCRSMTSDVPFIEFIYLGSIDTSHGDTSLMYIFISFSQTGYLKENSPPKKCDETWTEYSKDREYPHDYELSIRDVESVNQKQKVIKSDCRYFPSVYKA